MKETAILFVIACVFIVLAVSQIAISTSNTISVSIVDTKSTVEAVSVFTSSEETELININTATVSLLCKIDGIGQVKAQRIVDYREENGPFTCVEDLLNVYGIGEATLEKMRPYISVG